MKLLLLISVAASAFGNTVREPLPICPDIDGEESIYFPSYEDCTQFYQCSNGIPLLKDCPGGLYFDAILNVCNWAESEDEANCAGKPTGIPTLPSTESQTTDQHTELPTQSTQSYPETAQSTGSPGPTGSVDPTGYPTRYPTGYPTRYPTGYPTEYPTGYQTGSTESAPECGQAVFETESGEFSSPNYPGNYPNYVRGCRYSIVSPDATGAVRVRFVDFSTERNYDFVKVYNGADETGTLLATLSGRNLPETQTVFTSTSNGLYVSFSSDRSNTDRGFLAHWSTVCANRFGGPSGTIASPGYPGNYQNNLNECYFIEVSGGSRVQLTFDSFITESQYDILRIYDGDSASSPLLTALNGNASGRRLTSTGNTLYLVFTSDGSVGMSGFRASYIEV